MSLALGAPAADFDLPAVGGGRAALDNLADQGAVVVAFWCNHCPYVRAWEHRFNELAREYGERGAGFVAINANDAVAYPADGFEPMVERALDAEYAFAYARDDDQGVARAYGATRTPEVFVLDAARNVAYHGAVDDNAEPAAVRHPYLRDALEAILGGRAPAIPDTRPVGCTIKWSR